MDQAMADREADPNQQESSSTSPGGTFRQTAGSTVTVTITMNGPSGEAADSPDDEQDSKAAPARYRPRTFPYQSYLPYRADDRPLDKLTKCVNNLYISVSAGDFIPGATHWTREIRGWMQLKFDLPRDIRVRLAKLYYELSLAPGMENNAAERFSSMFIALTKRKHYLRAGEDLYLDWRPLYREIKLLALPSETSTVGSPSHQSKRDSRTLLKLCAFSQLYFDPEQTPTMLEEFLPYFSTSTPETGFAVVAMLNLLLPTAAPSVGNPKLMPQDLLPTLFHLWSLINRSKTFDSQFLDLLSRLARDSLVSEKIHFSEYGIFTAEQASMIFTAVLRLLEIPVSQVTSPYSSTVEMYVGLAAVLDRDPRKHPVAHHLARWIIMSLSPECAEKPDSILSKLESLIQAVETFFHPSNTGSWTKALAQLVFYLADFFVMRWNRERSGEMAVPKERQLTDKIKRRFVLCLRDVTFMGIFAKSGTAMSYSLSSLQSIAYLEPTLVLPGALQRIYPSMRGLVEVHRTSSSIRALHEITRIMARTKGYRCHVTSLLGLALPGIDANDLDKTMHTLSYMHSVFYEIPLCDLTPPQAPEEEKVDSMIAAQWVTSQIEGLDQSGVDLELDYGPELSDEDEVLILRSSTGDLHTFVSSFLERVFTLLRNLPDAARLKSGSPEENVANTLPATFTPLFASLSPELYDLALNRIATFVSNNVVYQARDAMAFICSALCKVNPKKALDVLVPILIRSIRSEIDDNGAGSTRTTGSEVLPRDRALVWNIGILSLSIVHVGSAVVDFEDDLFDIASYMQVKCKGIPSTHVSNFIHHLLLSLTMTYTVDHSLYEKDVASSGIKVSHWSSMPDPQNLSIKWHQPSEREVNFAVKIFKTFVGKETDQLKQLISDSPPIKRDGSGKEWSDEVSRSLVLIRLATSGMSCMFKLIEGSTEEGNDIFMSGSASADELGDIDEASDQEIDASLNAAEDEDVQPSFQYPTGYPLSPNSQNFKEIHEVRREVGETLHNVHQFLTRKQEDDVTSFNALYTAYRSWFTDVGMERSAHALDRSTRLLASDISHFKISGLRKEYPRPLLVRRANVYHLQRLRHNASPRHRTDLDVLLLDDLVQSSVSYYTEIRRTAQTAIEATIKVIVGAKPVIIPLFLDHFQSSIKTNDFPRIKGSMYSLLYGSLTKAIGRNWRFTPSLLRLYVDVMDIDKPSVQKLTTGATLQIMNMTRPIGRMVILDKTYVQDIASSDVKEDQRTQMKISRRKQLIKIKRARAEDERGRMADELADVAKKSHWKKESRTSTLVMGLSLRFDKIVSASTIDLVVHGTIDTHPSLRAIYQSAFIGLYTFVDMRAVSDHTYEKLLLDEKTIPAFIKKAPETDSPQWTEEFLSGFTQADADAYIDQDYPGWLVWGKTMPAYDASKSCALQYDEIENGVRARMGRFLGKSWFATYFGYMRQEPRDSSSDRFRMTAVFTLRSAFSLCFDGLSVASLDEVKELIKENYGDGSDKHQHRSMAEILCALLDAATVLDVARREEVWTYAFPIVRSILADGLNPENINYWSTFLDVLITHKDPRRAWPLVEWLANFRLDMNSNAAFKESSKITLLEHCITDLGWHFQLEKPVLQDFLDHLDHPYKGVREVIGMTLACIYRTRYHESYMSVDKLLEIEKAASSVGSRPYIPSPEYVATLNGVFAKLEKWRLERPAGQQTASPYTSGCKTVLSWLDNVLSSYECVELIPFFPDTFLEALLHMMDIKEDPELQALAYLVFRHLGNIPFRAGEEDAFVTALIRVGKTATSWHQRLRILINMQAIYFRHLFMMPQKRQSELFSSVSAMLEDHQLEVRIGAGATLSGMIRCSSVALRAEVIKDLTKKYVTMLQRNPLPRTKNPGTPTPEHQRLILVRHAAVLGLGALVQAFPYTSPPPEWMPSVLATLASKAAGDPGMVGKSAKSIVSDFKKTRQDTWHIDIKAFKQEQLEDLEGVLWKSYFA